MHERGEATGKGAAHCNADNATRFSVPGSDNRRDSLRFDCLMNELRFLGQPRVALKMRMSHRGRERQRKGR